MDELDQLSNAYGEYEVSLGSENIHGKVNILLQTFLSRGHVKSFSLVSDLAYISQVNIFQSAHTLIFRNEIYIITFRQNASRIMRALFDIVLKRNNPYLAGRFLIISQMFEKQQWFFETPLRQFTTLSQEIIDKLETRNIDIDKLREMDAKEIGKVEISI